MLLPASSYGCAGACNTLVFLDGKLSRAEAAVELSVKSPGPSCPGGVSLACKCSSLSTELELVRMVICLGAQVEQVHRELLCCELRGTFAEGSQRIQINMQEVEICMFRCIYRENRTAEFFLHHL
jgi:hypothetical protein